MNHVSGFPARGAGFRDVLVGTSHESWAGARIAAAFGGDSPDVGPGSPAGPGARPADAGATFRAMNARSRRFHNAVCYAGMSLSAGLFFAFVLTLVFSW